MKAESDLGFRRGARLAAAAPFAALLCGALPALATPILGSELASFAVLGSSAVTNTGATTLGGNLGVSPGSAISGLGTITMSGAVHQNDPFATLAQSELATAKTSLGLLGPGTLLPADLVGLTLAPGVYTVPAGVSNLTGALTLDGMGNANAAWVFQMDSSLITSSGSVVNVINTGAGAGVYWNVASSATVGATTSFEGNILASTAITLDHAATIGCGRVLAQTAAVTLDNDTIDSLLCTGAGAEGSGGLSGGLDVTTTPGGTVVSFLPFAPVSSVPEPAMLLIFAFALAGVIGFRKSSMQLPAGLLAPQ